MHFKSTKCRLLIILITALAWPAVPTQARAQTYPIDCAILLCLAGGWPASLPCARARSEFIRRVTPWPVEPPLQIWRCPMGASFDARPDPRSTNSIIEAVSGGRDPQPHFSRRRSKPAQKTGSMRIHPYLGTFFGALIQADYAVHSIQNRAHMDISAPEFNFVRSLRVFDVRYAWQRETGESGICKRSATVMLGTYGAQGDFSWQRASPSALPAAHNGLEQWGQHCPSIYHRSVFVDWRDFRGTYGAHQVNY